MIGGEEGFCVPGGCSMDSYRPPEAGGGGGGALDRCLTGSMVRRRGAEYEGWGPRAPDSRGVRAC